MFLRQNKRRKNGKMHRYFSVVENRRVSGQRSVQRQVLYLGEINDSQQQAWRRTLEVFDEDRKQYCQLSLFPHDRPLPPGAADAISVKLDEMRLHRPRSFGDCWLGCWLWDQLQLSSFWNQRLPDGLPLAYEVFAGNTTDKTTLRQFLAKIEQLHGKAWRVWVMDRGIPTEATLQEMREAGTQYLVGTPRSMLSKLDQSFADKPWQQVHEAMTVKLARHEGEFYVLAHSNQRQLKEKAMRRRRFKMYVRGLHALRRRCRPGQRSRLSRDTLLGRLAVLKQAAGRMAAAVVVHIPDEAKRPTPETFHYELDAAVYQEALERDGSYILRSNVAQADAATMWSMYMQLVWIESAFKSMKSDLAIRPIWHQLQPRVEAHLFVAFMGYCMMAALRKRLEPAAPGLSPKAVLEQLAAIQMVDVCLPTSDGRWLIMPRHTEPEQEQLMLLQKLGLELPAQPPPRIRSGTLLMPERKEAATEM